MSCSLSLSSLVPAGGVNNAFCLTQLSDVSSGVPVPAGESYSLAEIELLNMDPFTPLNLILDPGNSQVIPKGDLI